MSSDIYANTKELAKELGLSLPQLAIDAGLTRNAIYNWRNVRPQERSIRAVAKVLNVTPQFLKGETTYRNSVDLEDGHNASSDTESQFFDLNFLENYNVGYNGHRLSNEDIELIKNLVSPVLDRISRK